MSDPKLIEKPYLEIVDDALTAIVGGVVNEPHVFDVKVAEYPLAESSRDIRSITGTSQGARRTFQKDVDFEFLAGTDTEPAKVRWLMSEQGTPDDGTQFFVDYFRESSTSPLTDLNVGSVTRTLAEAFSREVAVVYEQVNLAYLSGFIDHATGKSLDFVVAILDITRRTAEFATGLVTFFRSPGSTGSITINAGISLANEDGTASFETTDLRTVQPGQERTDVPVRAAVGGEDGIVEANTINQLLQPIEGVDRVTNFDPTQTAAAAETDAELRKRAKAKLRGLNQCTVHALLTAALEAGAEDVEIRDPQWPAEESGKWTSPGRVEVLLKGDPDRLEAVEANIDDRRAAGILVNVTVRQVLFKPRIQIRVDASVTPAGRVQVQKDVVGSLASYAAALTSGQPVSGAELRTAVARALGVNADSLANVASLRDVLVWVLDPSDRSRPTERVARHDLLVHDGAPATDEQIQAWDFAVQTEVDGNKALPILDLSFEEIAFTR